MGRHTRIELSGEMVVGRAAELRDVLLAALACDGALDVDLAQVTEIDSTGVQLLVAAKLEASARGSSLQFVEHSPTVLEVLDLLDLTAYFGDPVLLQAGTAKGSR